MIEDTRATAWEDESALDVTCAFCKNMVSSDDAEIVRIDFTNKVSSGNVRYRVRRRTVWACRWCQDDVMECGHHKDSKRVDDEGGEYCAECEA